MEFLPAHTRDDPYDMEKALSILNHVCDFRGSKRGLVIAPIGFCFALSSY